MEVTIDLICDGGYLHWPTLICPFKHALASSPVRFIFTNLESILEDVECLFGIMKKRWRILDYGICFRDIKVGHRIFVTC